MPRPLRGNIADLIQTLFVVGVVGDLTDSELLERFTSDRNGESEAAFRVLIVRDGPMVWRVCRSVLADSHDAQDAFQATFLVLVRKANGLWVRDSLGPWLHRVALRTAKTVRRAASHRRAHERAAAVASIVLHDEPADDVATLLHEEINRLPVRFRAPIVLCDLDGLTHEHAVRQLGWPLGTVKSRIARGRERLRNRLTRRGFSAPFPVVALPSSTPAGLAGLTTDLALRSLASRTLVSGSTAVLLAQEVLHSMSILRWTQAAAAMLLVSATVVATPSRAEKTGEAQAPKTADKAEKPRADNVPTVTVGPGKVKIQITRQGTVEAANSASVYSNVEGQTTIMSLLPEGTKVKKGDVVARLDESALKDQFTNQRIAENGAEAAYLNAKLTREVAEIALTEYVEGIFKQDLETVQGEVLGAQTAVKRAEAKLERTRRAREQLTRVLPPTKEKMTPSDILADLELDDRLDAAEVALAREKIGVTLAQSKQNVLLKFTKVKVVKELTSAIEKAKQEELSKKAAWELAKSKSAKFERQIAACTLVAPRDGTVIYGSAPASLSPGKSAIEEGATVRERQIVFHIPDQSRDVGTGRRA